MAIKKTKQLNNGVSVTDAYIRVEKLSIVDKTECSFALAHYADDSQDEPFFSLSLTAPYDIDGDNPFAQAYSFVKSLNIYSGSVDV